MNLNAIKKLRSQLDKHHYKCKEWCFECCTITPALDIEVKIMIKELRKKGYTETPKGKWPKYCEMLTPEGKCSVYEQRPIICRAFSDIGYRWKVNGKEIITPSCNYGTKNVVDASNEFKQYWKTLIEKGVIIGAIDDIVEDSPMLGM